MRTEIAEERRFVRWARNHGLEALKLSVIGYRGWPDRLILGPGRRILFLEFKTKGEEADPLQEYIHKKIKKLSFPMATVDSVEDAKSIVRRVFRI